MISLMRVIRELNQVSIDELAAAIGSRKGTVSVAERFAVAGPKLETETRETLSAAVGDASTPGGCFRIADAIVETAYRNERNQWDKNSPNLKNFASCETHAGLLTRTPRPAGAIRELSRAKAIGSRLSLLVR